MLHSPAVEYINRKVRISEGKPVLLHEDEAIRNDAATKQTPYRDTLAYKIIQSHVCVPPHSITSPHEVSIKFDALVSHDITYVSIIQTARAAGMKYFPVPYALTNCHNSLCAVGGTINEDDHAFGLSAARKYGGIYVPANQAVIHQYVRETLTGCGKMILGSDSHTRYGCYGTLGIGEGGGELVRQLLGHTYDIRLPDVTLVWLEGAPRRGIGPHDAALAIIKEVFPEGKVKNKILEFAGPGISSLPIDFRAGIDVMTTETGCLSSIWETDDTVHTYYKATGRKNDYALLKVKDGAVYGSMITIDLTKIESMIALPFHPSKAFTIHELQQNPECILREAGDACNTELGFDTDEPGCVKLDLLRCLNTRNELCFEQGVIVGCAGGLFSNISEAADILNGNSIGNGYFDLSVYPASTPISLAITRQGIAESLMNTGVVLKPAFCGPCFGAGDTPAHNTLSIRHATRNFASREGSKPADGQISAVVLMDARSIAATAINGGVLTAATDIEYSITPREFTYDGHVYETRCYNGFSKPDPAAELRMGPNITDWPEFTKLSEHLLLKLCAVIFDEVTTTDELIPSGDTSSYRSNPIRLSEYTLSRRVPGYAAMSKDAVSEAGKSEAGQVLARIRSTPGDMAPAPDIDCITIGTCIFAKKPGDGSAREQAASCQRVLGGRANICYEYATKRYRSNCINWGIIPFTISRDETFSFTAGDWIYIENIRHALISGEETISAKVIAGDTGKVSDIKLGCENLSKPERAVIIEGCLMNYYKECK